MSGWLYLAMEEGMQGYSVGFYDPKGNWIEESRHAHRLWAQAQVHYLNGGEEETSVGSNQS